MNFEAFFKLTYGLYILSSKDGDRFNGHISNTVFQVTAKPPRIAVASHRDNLTSDFIKTSKVFSISALQKDISLEFMGPWGFKSGRELNKFEKVGHKIGKTGVPVVTENCIAWYECEVEEIIEIGTHILFVGKVVDLDVLDKDKEPLNYDYYRYSIKGVSPQNSPTYLGEAKTDDHHEEKVEAIADKSEEKAEAAKLKKYRCTICGHIYDPAEGDPPAGIPAGTAFEDIPDDWTCPICGVTKADFIPYD